MDLVYALLIGLVAGWLAGKIRGGEGYGVLGNMIIGVVGSVIGHFLVGVLGFDAKSLLARIITATIGALVLLAVANAIGKSGKKK
jgi:uncharacterized membrane protein YeaQ/YmgE (transglycosylase-associated protein family)